MKTNLGKIRIPNLSEIAAPDTVGTQQLRTRDKVFHAIGKTIDIGIDTAEFTAETTGYVIGRAMNGVRNVIKATAHGNNGDIYRHAA